MIRILNANLKKFMGAKYERIPRTLIIWAIVFISLQATEIKLEITPVVLWLTTLCLTVSGFVGVLSSDDTVDSLRGQLMLPENPIKFHAAFFLSVLLYTLLTKTGLLLIGYLALSKNSVPAVIGFIICFFGAGVIVYPLAFRSEKKTAASHYVGGTGHNFVMYLWRYLWNNKNYLVNTAVLWAFGCAFAVFMSKVNFPNIFLLGLALMCLNTPLGILLSSDRALYRQVRFLPGQIKKILLPYALFVIIVNAAACTVFLITWYLVTGTITPSMVVLAMFFSLVSATLTVLLEIKYPLLNWKVESDLWHHPRKYIVPGIMVIIASIFIVALGKN